jgi:hypothetical protein
MEFWQGIDSNDLGVRWGQLSGEVPGHEGPGIAGSEDDYAVVHLSLSFNSLALGELTGTAAGLLTGTSCDLHHSGSGGH